MPRSIDIPIHLMFMVFYLIKGVSEKIGLKQNIRVFRFGISICMKLNQFRG